MSRLVTCSKAACSVPFSLQIFRIPLPHNFPPSHWPHQLCLSSFEGPSMDLAHLTCTPTGHSMAVIRVLPPPAEAGGSGWPWQLLFEYIFFCEQMLPWKGGVGSIVFGKRWGVWVISEHLGGLTALVWHLCSLLVLARVATRYHKLGGFNNRNVFLTTVEAETSIRVPAECVWWVPASWFAGG